MKRSKLTDLDYARLYNQIEPKPRMITVLEFLLFAVVALALGLLKGCGDDCRTQFLERATEDTAWYLRHERQSAQCRGQQYVAACCEDARTDLTCIDAELKVSQREENGKKESK